MRVDAVPPLWTPATKTPLVPPPKSIRRLASPDPGQAIGRAMTTPAQDVAPRAPKPAEHAPQARYVLSATGEIVPEGEELGDEGSDVSSICHSPGWDDYGEKRRRKEKSGGKERRTKRNEGREPGPPVMGEGPCPSPSRQRLSKPPPARKRLSKLPTSTDRARAAPVEPGPPGKQEAKEKKAGHGRSSSASVERGLKGFKAMTAPWKSPQDSSSATPTGEVPSSRRSFVRKSTLDGDEFMGGLKLEQHLIRQQRTEPGEGPALHHDRVAERPTTLNSSSIPSLAQAVRPAMSRSGDVHDQAATAAHGPKVPVSPAHPPPPVHLDLDPTERNIPTARQSHPPSSPRTFPDATDPGSPRRDRASANPRQTTYSNTRHGESRPSHGRAASVALPLAAEPLPSSERGKTMRKPTVHKSYPPTTRSQGSHVRYQRQESETKAATALQDHDSDSSKKPRGRRNSFTKVIEYVKSRSRSRQRSQDPPTLVAGEGTDANAAFMPEPDVIKQFHLERSTTASEFSNPTVPSSKGPPLQGLKNAARSAFSRTSVNGPDSPSIESFKTAQETRGSSNTLSSKRASVAESRRRKSGTFLSKAENSVAPNSALPPTPYDWGVKSPPPGGAPENKEKSAGTGPGKFFPDVMHDNNRLPNHSRSATMDSSEEYSTLDEFSSATTPTASRPNSQKDDFSVKAHLNEQTENSPIRTTTITLGELSPRSPTLNSAFSFEEGVDCARPSWRGTGADPEPPVEEGKMEPSMRKMSRTSFATDHPSNSVPQFSLPSSPPPVSRVPKAPPISVHTPRVSELQRAPGLSRFESTPELQDLSFLPALKHQALTRPQRSKEMGIAVSGGKENEATSCRSGSKTSVPRYTPSFETPLRTLPRPVPTSISNSPTTKFESSSSSTHFNYTQSGRFTLPRTPQTTSPISPVSPVSPQLQTGPDPIAKMLVVCCSCKYFHDLPSKVYECMAQPDDVVTDQDLGVSGVVSTSVKCPWCGHGMSTTCCAGYAAVVFLKERLH